MNKNAVSAAPLHPLIAERWSPRAFDSRSLDPEALISILESARWAPSSGNHQPSSFVVVTPEDETRSAVVAALSPGNQTWAGRAPALLVAVARLTLEGDGRPNRYAWHDVGIATGQMLAQVTALGLSAHVMAGFDAAAMRIALGIPEGFEPVSVIAVGHRTHAESLPEALRQRETAPRSRRPLEATAFRGRFGVPIQALAARGAR